MLAIFPGVEDCHRSPGTESYCRVHVLHETWNKAFFTSHSCSASKEVLKKKARSTCSCFANPNQPYCFLPFSLTSPLLNKGTLSNYDDNSVKKQLVLCPKHQLCTYITLFSTFLWRPLHDYGLKPPNATLYGGRRHTTINFPFSISTWINPLRIQLQEKRLHLTN